jgi:hypothetical protein
MIFNQLMFCLSSDSIKDHSEYKNWSPLSGRLRCFEKLRQYLDIIYPINKEELKIPPHSFHDLLYGCLSSSIGDRAKPGVTTISLLDLRKHDEVGLLTIEDDLKVKSINLKDDIDVLLRKSSNNVLKAIRNEKVSQSLQVNKISDIEDKVVPNNNEYIYQNDDYEEVNLVNKSKFNNYEQDNPEVDFSDIEEETVINNKKGKDDLSDLDKEEYYMKSCYEFYDYVNSELI